MSAAELQAAGAYALLGLFLLVRALSRASRLLPRREPPAHRWPVREGLAVIATPFLVLLAFGLLAKVVPARAAAAAGAAAGDGGLADLLASQLVLGGAVALAVLLAARRPHGLESLGLRTRAAPRAFASVLLVYGPLFLCFLGLGAFWARACHALGWEEQQDVVRVILGLERRELAVAAAVAVLFAPLIEELLFRGFLQAFLAQALGERSALVVVSAVFARLHGVASLPLLFALSLFLGWLQLRTRCVWVPWFAHALNNARFEKR